MIRMPGIFMSSAVGGQVDSHSAYRFGSARIEYPWHPLHGQRLRVVQRFVCGGSEIVWLGERPDYCRELPAWMCDAAACQGMALLGSPMVALDALDRLAALLRQPASGADTTASSPASSTKEASDAESQTAERTTVAGPQPIAAANTGCGTGRSCLSAGGPASDSHGPRHRRRAGGGRR